MKRALLVAAVLLAATVYSLKPAPVTAQASDAYLGQIMLFAGNFAPTGWALCEGQTLPIAENTALFAILGTTYGGNGTTTFCLPDLRDAQAPLRPKGSTVGPVYVIALRGVFPSRS
jgi:microcystin-dependent protein